MTHYTFASDEWLDHCWAQREYRLEGYLEELSDLYEELRRNVVPADEYGDELRAFCKNRVHKIRYGGAA